MLPLKRRAFHRTSRRCGSVAARGAGAAGIRGHPRARVTQLASTSKVKHERGCRATPCNSLSVKVIQAFRRYSFGVTKFALSGRSFQRGDFPCFEKQSSLLPSPPRLVEQSLLPRLMLPRVEVAAVGVDMAAAGVVVTVVADLVGDTVAGSPVDTVAGSVVDTLVASAVAASVAVGLGVEAFVVARLAVSAAGLVVSAEQHLVAVSGELDWTASAAEASASPAFTAGAFPSRQV
jgi:hypothetical protein